MKIGYPALHRGQPNLQDHSRRILQESKYSSAKQKQTADIGEAASGEEVEIVIVGARVMEFVIGFLAAALVRKGTQSLWVGRERKLYFTIRQIDHQYCTWRDAPYFQAPFPLPSYPPSSDWRYHMVCATERNVSATAERAHAFIHAH